jgi:hypothetical protein
MSHFAKVVNGVVVNVIVAEADFFETYVDNTPGEWVQTSYNTFAGQHPEGRPLRKNYAMIGGTYDKERDAFIPIKQYSTWVLNEETCQWDAPVEYPSDGKEYIWSDEQVNWIER